MKVLKKIGGALKTVVDRAGFVCLVASGVMMIVMGLLVTQGVVRRYLFESSEPYSYELTCYLLLACMLLSAVHVTIVGRHIRADLLFNLFPRRLRSVLEGVVIPLSGMLFCTVVTWKSWELAWVALQTHKVSIGMGIPIFFIQVIVPVAIGLVGLVLLSQIVGYLGNIVSNIGKSGGSE